MELKFLQRHQLLNSVGKHIPTVVDEGRKFRTLLVMKLEARTRMGKRASACFVPADVSYD